LLVEDLDVVFFLMSFLFVLVFLAEGY
jgi:hypothetical protein